MPLIQVVMQEPAGHFDARSPCAPSKLHKEMLHCDGVMEVRRLDQYQKTAAENAHILLP